MWTCNQKPSSATIGLWLDKLFKLFHLHRNQAELADWEPKKRELAGLDVQMDPQERAGSISKLCCKTVPLAQT